MKVVPKKYLGQHFLKDVQICKRIADAILINEPEQNVLEIGPGTGALTQFLIPKNFSLVAYEVDIESIEYLSLHYPDLKLKQKDILSENWGSVFEGQFTIVGNFPYNISSQIVFKVFENRSIITQLLGMFQKEVAERICAQPGTKKYGILSVLIQAFYKTRYLFTVNEEVFDPPPKVKSGVIRFERNEIEHLNCDEILFVKVVKSTFNQRRKMVRNSIKGLCKDHNISHELMTKRPEQLSVNDFIQLTNLLESKI
ncbi:16S rRNA (adenine(1518)-N(6)/adenine(1519)-N(6))-dimethyltransferase RsmA [Bacteroidota bacterium]|nr:16S rRNA (adenine(1518)-N(6)/adenine(1519)-N(6))-dimethyltransferase RsmA [Bacteroidota bacterium]